MKYLDTILQTYGKYFSDSYTGYEPLTSGVSDKRIIRIKSSNSSVVGIYNSFTRENITFLEFTKVFAELGLNVAKILYVSDDFKVYFLSDLGEKTLFDSDKGYKGQRSINFNI